MQTKNHRVRFLSLAKTIGGWERGQGLLCVDRELRIVHYATGATAIKDAMVIGYKILDGSTIYLAHKPDQEDVDSLYNLGATEVCYLVYKTQSTPQQLYDSIPQHVWADAELKEDIKLYKMALFYDDIDENPRVICCDLNDEMHNSPNFESYISDQWEVVNFTAIKEQHKNRVKLQNMQGFSLRYRIALIRDQSNQSVRTVLVNSAISYESVKQSANFIRFLTQWIEVKI